MAFDCFLKIDVIPGESTDDAHAEWIELLSFSHGVSQEASGAASSGGSLSAERCDHQDFSVVKTLDKASPKLNLFCCNGTHIEKINIQLCRAGGDKQTYMEYKMSGCIVKSVRPGGSAQGGEALPLEEVSFSYGKIEWTYTETAGGEVGGNVETHWDLITNTGG